MYLVDPPALISMSFPRLSLLITVLAFGGFGLWLLVRPTALAAVDVELPTATARTEVRGFYGGLELGLAVFFAACAFRPAWYRPGLAAQVATLLGIAGGRVVGLAVEGGSTAIVAFAAMEAVAGLIGVAALRTLRER